MSPKDENRSSAIEPLNLSTDKPLNPFRSDPFDSLHSLSADSPWARRLPAGTTPAIAQKCASLYFGKGVSAEAAKPLDGFSRLTAEAFE